MCNSHFQFGHLHLYARCPHSITQNPQSEEHCLFSVPTEDTTRADTMAHVCSASRLTRNCPDTVASHRLISTQARACVLKACKHKAPDVQFNMHTHTETCTRNYTKVCVECERMCGTLVQRLHHRRTWLRWLRKTISSRRSAARTDNKKLKHVTLVDAGRRRHDDFGGAQ